MSDIAIKVNDLHKKYDLGVINSGTISGDIKSLWARIRGQEDPISKIGANSKGEYWALNGVNFEVKKGESVGVIGKNGAGKSTLLKILSRVTIPAKGKVSINGKIASLLEVGTGFHPDLTGRENIYMNGAILGMSRHEIKNNLDQIIAFSGVERYIDTPVKRYSSGMYVRLAFAVAAHLDPDILIVDEVLAVGDAEFQQKCLGKMKNVSESGRTVLFVSHNMQAVNSLCSKAIFLNEGQSSSVLNTADAINTYLKDLLQTKTIKFPVIRNELIVHDYSIQQNGNILMEYFSEYPIDVVIDFELKSDVKNFRIGFYIKNSFDEIICRSLFADWNEDFTVVKAGRYKITTSIMEQTLAAGNYYFQIHSSIFAIRDYHISDECVYKINIIGSSLYNRPYVNEIPVGVMLLNTGWKILNA